MDQGLAVRFRAIGSDAYASAAGGDPSPPPVGRSGTLLGTRCSLGPPGIVGHLYPTNLNCANEKAGISFSHVNP